MPHGRGNRDTFKCDGGCYYDKAMKKKTGAGRDRTVTVDSAKCQPPSKPATQAKKIKDGQRCLICRKPIKVRPSAARGSPHVVVYCLKQQFILLSHHADWLDIQEEVQRYVQQIGR